MAKAIGYARQISGDDDLSTQIDDLRAAGCEVVYSDKNSPEPNADRPGLAHAFAALAPGDFLMVTGPDRLSVSMEEYGEIVSALVDRGVQVSILGIDDDLCREQLSAAQRWPVVH